MNVWRVDEMCGNCPFRTDGKAIELMPGRLKGIKRDLTRGGYNASDFYCHKTAKGESYDDEGEEIYVRTGAELLCAGAIDYQESKGCSSQYRRVAERLDAMRVHS